MMKAIVQGKYGLSDVLQLKDIEKPVVKDDEALVRVHAGAVDIGDWDRLRGVPCAIRARWLACSSPSRRYRDWISPVRLRQSAGT
jgi:NADPH:quinone reductase-like Zn-dependent oxidoreductase